ncbi:MAG: hydroxypyruvate isomerase family protein [Burkholderiaceae bacterium]|jgi:hydroxypyruvate isomerase|nr:hydroxypyruvate isomerase family protein [Burkholderiaceae bacterium]
MPKLAANLSMLFTEVPFMDRFDAAAKAGFKGVEFLFPYAYNLNEMEDKLKKNNLELVLFNLPAGNWEGGDRGIGCDPSRVGEFQDGVGQAISAAKKLGVKQVNCLGGKTPSGVSDDKIRAAFSANLKFAGDKLKAEGIRLLAETVNDIDIAGAYMVRTQQAIDIIKASGSDNVFLQYDIYHMQRMEGELANTIKSNFDLIKHYQLADNPGRNEPGTGEINYRFLFKFLDGLGYDGWIGCEYRPKTTTVEGLSWIAAHQV